MNRYTVLLSMFLWGAFPCWAVSSFSKTNVKQVLQRVADWQIAHQKDVTHGELNWTNATLYIGMAKWAALAEETDHNDSYYKWLIQIGNRNYWQVDKRMYHADDICVAQMYIDLYRKYGKKAMLVPTLARADWVIAHPSRGGFKLDYSKPETLERWTWCDALFMAPPVYARLYRLTGDKKYIRFMNKEYKAACDFLFDREENLFFRDWHYFDKKEKNGEKIFWGRGNGWVLGGLTEILRELPKGNRYRKFYEDLFVSLCIRIVGLQQPDGFWRASMLDPASYPSPETSCTTFIVYALAYGINEGLLPVDHISSVVEKGWRALLSAVSEDGKLGYVQPVGADPRKVTKDMTEVYGVGAFLMAGFEVYKMAE